ncbi:hypothetical protein B0H34DRAFT_676947 [Crassisporium funariophilum]|nr:hypothetical protein B0H34DRAFT_676947 [Crassisporium funariophilum]
MSKKVEPRGYSANRHDSEIEEDILLGKASPLKKPPRRTSVSPSRNNGGNGHSDNVVHETQGVSQSKSALRKSPRKAARKSSVAKVDDVPVAGPSNLERKTPAKKAENTGTITNGKAEVKKRPKKHDWDLEDDDDSDPDSGSRHQPLESETTARKKAVNPASKARSKVSMKTAISKTKKMVESDDHADGDDRSAKTKSNARTRKATLSAKGDKPTTSTSTKHSSSTVTKASGCVKVLEIERTEPSDKEVGVAKKRSSTRTLSKNTVISAPAPTIGEKATKSKPKKAGKKVPTASKPKKPRQGQLPDIPEEDEEHASEEERESRTRPDVSVGQKSKSEAGPQIASATHSKSKKRDNSNIAPVADESPEPPRKRVRSSTLKGSDLSKQSESTISVQTSSKRARDASDDESEPPARKAPKRTKLSNHAESKPGRKTAAVKDAESVPSSTTTKAKTKSAGAQAKQTSTKSNTTSTRKENISVLEQPKAKASGTLMRSFQLI